MSYDNTTVVSTDWLGSRFAHPHLRVLDGSWYLPASGRNAREEFAAGHIPGARFFDIDEIARFFDIDEIKDTANPLPHMLPDAAQFAREVSALGIGNDDQVVVYDGSGLYSAARVWWTFRAFGHENVAVLDGGLPKWRAERRPIKGSTPVIEPREFEASLNPALVRGLEDIRANLDGRHEQVLDARSAERFAGTAPEIRPGIRAGHIPGSLNLPFDRLIDAETGFLRDEAALRAAFEAAGGDLGRAVVTTCGSGVTAPLLALGLSVLGHQRNAVYDGWSEMGQASRHTDRAVTRSGRGPSPRQGEPKRRRTRRELSVAADAHSGKLECVITELEMRRAPKLPPLRAPPGKLALLRAENPTVSFYRYLYDAVGRDWLWTDRKRLSDKRLAAIIGDDHVEVYVLYVRGVPAGFAELDLRALPDIDLAYLGLVPEHIGRGLGSYLLNWIVRRAWERAPSRLRVYTNTFNHPRALSLYQRMGFVPRNRRTVYVDPDPDPPHP